MGIGRRKATGVVDPFAEAAWNQVLDAPRPDLPSAERLSRKARRMRVFVWASLILAPLTLIVALFAVTARPEVPDYEAESARASASESAAVAYVQQWLAQDPSPLPGGKFISHDGSVATDVPAKSTDDEIEQGLKTETHQMTVATQNRTYTVGVSVLSSPLLGAVVIGEPSLMLRPDFSSDMPSVSTWPGHETMSAPNEVKNAIAVWADAYAGDDPTALRLSVGDESAEHFYLPLGAAEVSDVKIGQAAAVWPDGDKPDRDDVPEVLVARVTMTVLWTETPQQSDLMANPDESAGATISFDLLIRKAHTAAPVVVAWGVPGSGFALNDYENAIDGIEVEVPDRDEKAGQ